MTTASRIVYGVLVLAVAGLAYWALQPQPVAVDVAGVTQGPFEQTVSDDGKTRVRDRYLVSAPLAGRVARIDLRAGDPIVAGQVIAVLTPAVPAFLDARAERELRERVGSAEAQQMRAKADTGKAQALLAQVKSDAERAAKLSAQGFVAKTALEQAELAVRTAERSVEAAQFAEHAAEHDVDQARAALTRYRADSAGKTTRNAKWEVRSPVTGSVLKVVRESEGAVGLGEPLLEVAEPRSLEAVVDVLSQDAVALRPGMPARLELGVGVPPLGARVRRVEPAAFTKISALGLEEQRVNVVLDFTDSLERVQTIGDGFRIEAHIVVFRADSALKAPVGALFREVGNWSVYVIADGRATRRQVKVGRTNGVEALIEDGLKAGESVVVYPPDALRDGSQVVHRAARGATK